MLEKVPIQMQDHTEHCMKKFSAMPIAALAA
jgi:hypothetical protein